MSDETVTRDAYASKKNPVIKMGYYRDVMGYFLLNCLFEGLLDTFIR